MAFSPDQVALILSPSEPRVHGRQRPHQRPADVDALQVTVSGEETALVVPSRVGRCLDGIRE